MYYSNPKMRVEVINIEEENKERKELQQQADKKQKEADALRWKPKHQKQ